MPVMARPLSVHNHITVKPWAFGQPAFGCPVTDAVSEARPVIRQQAESLVEDCKKASLDLRWWLRKQPVM